MTTNQRRIMLSGVERKAMLRVGSPPLSIVSDTSLFARQKPGTTKTYALLLQDSAFGRWDDELSEVVQSNALKCSDNQIFVLDLSGLVKGDPRILASGLRKAVVALARVRKRKPAAPRLAIQWGYRSAEVPLRTAFALAWEVMDRDAPKTRVAVPWREGPGRRLGIVGHLPPVLAARAERLSQDRLLTYHNMLPRPVGRVSITVQKECLRLLKRFQDLGLVVDRGFASGADEVELGLSDSPRERGRVKIYESVVAAAGVL